MGAYHNALREEGSRAELIRELEKCWAILDIIDKRAPRADRTCAQPGITLSEAARRQLRDEGHPLFQEGGRVMDTLALLQNDSRDLWEENRALVRRLSRMEAYAVQRREAMRRFVDLVNDGHFDGGAVPMKEYAMFRLFERDVERWEEWDAKHPFLGEEGA